MLPTDACFHSLPPLLSLLFELQMTINGLFVFSSHVAIDGHGGQDDRVGDDEVVAPCGYSGDFEAICSIVASGLRLSGLPIMLHVFNASVVFT